MAKGKLKAFLGKVGKHLGGAALEIVKTGSPTAALGYVVNELKGKSDNDEVSSEFLREFEINKMELENEAYELEIEDRKRATDLFKSDSFLQKVYAISYLVMFFLFGGAILWGVYSMVIKGIEIPALPASIITGIEVKLSNKIGTMVDFLFGGSASKEKS